jgi:hypothetical protein
MNKTIIILLFIGLLVSCSKDRSFQECETLTDSYFKEGYALADGSYEVFVGNYAAFERQKLYSLTEEWEYAEKEHDIIFGQIDHWCHQKMNINCKNIDISVTDTINILYSRLGLAQDYPTASLRFKDDDALIETYHLLEDADNWLIIDKVSADSTKVEGRFQMSFITSREIYLNNERERWDDPNRPNILHFTNGEFRAVFLDF